jgi:peptide deformylase
VDPAILEASGAQRDFDGCLSFPGLYAETARPHHLKVTGLDERGNPFERVFRGFDAVLVHHEIDHLEGILFIDRVQSIKDLYTIMEDEFGRQVRKPLADSIRQAEDPLRLSEWKGPIQATLPRRRRTNLT